MTAGKPNNRNSGGGDLEFARWFIDRARAAGYDTGPDGTKRGWQSKLGRDAGVALNNINRYVNGQSVPSPAACAELYRYLDTTEDELLIRAGYKTRAGASESNGGSATYRTALGRSVDLWLARHDENDPQRKRIEESIRLFLELADGSSSGTAG